MSAPAVFLDKDGTLIKNIPYNADIKKIKFEETVFEGLRILQKAGFILAVASNQSGVGRDLITQTQIKKAEHFISGTLRKKGIMLNHFFYCFHYEQNCSCRKPKQGLLITAAKKLNLNLDRSWIIGDILNDIEAGNRAGCRSILLDNGGETEYKTGPFRTPAYKASTFADAALFILFLKDYPEC